MKISELMNIVQLAQDKNREVFIINSKEEFTSSIDYSFDDNNDIQLYEIATGAEN